MSQRVTLGDIARVSGVSLATVSLVLRNKPGINKETRQRVLETAETMGYNRRPASTRAGALAPLENVGVIIKNLVGETPHSNPFYAPMLAGIEEMCRRQQLHMLFATVPVDSDNHPTELPRMLLDGAADGLILIGAFVDSTLSQILQRTSTPAVLIDAYASDYSCDAVIADNFQGAFEAVSYLIASGHRHIGIVGSQPEAYPSIAERRRGYLAALGANGISEQYFADSRLTQADMADAALALLEREPQVTALFCCNDDGASSVLRAVRAKGYCVPKEVSIMGFDNIDLATRISPALTTMHIDTAQMCRIAMQLLLNRAENPTASQVTAVVRPTLVERQSVASRSA